MIGTLAGMQLQKAPIGLLQPTSKASSWEPRSVGVDGLFYGRHGFDGVTSAQTVIRSSDGFATVELGYDFAPVLPAGEGLSWTTRTTDGYVACSHSVANDTGTIYYSPDFAGPFTVKATMRATQLLAISRPVTSRRTGKTVLLVGEYNSGGVNRKLRGSFDGGVNWAVLRDGFVADAGTTAHWHNSAYDPESDRLWASHGDGPNARTEYSDDLGVTWVEHTVNAAWGLGISGAYQPTAVVPLRQRFAVAPDSGSADTGIWQANKPGMDLAPVHSALPGVQTFTQYGQAPYALEGGECYVAYGPSGADTDRLVIAATGDDGRSWHNVYDDALSGGSHNSGIVGPDSAGRLAWKSMIGTTGTLFVADRITFT